MRRVRISVPDLSCGHCVQAVRTALEPLAGVSDVDVSLERKEAEASVAEGVGDEVILDAVRRAGYTPEVA
ncbi:MAG: heavy-metal-associated domain-containing protein [Gemmatimonadota bacterium]